MFVGAWHQIEHVRGAWHRNTLRLSRVRDTSVTRCHYVVCMAGVLDLGIDLDVWPWVWLGVAVLFALVELTLLAGSFVLLPFAVSAFVAALAGFYDASVEIQWAIFFFLGAVLWIAFWKYAKRFANDNAMPAGCRRRPAGRDDRHRHRRHPSRRHRTARPREGRRRGVGCVDRRRSNRCPPDRRSASWR